MTPTLYLIPVTLGDTPVAQVLPSYNTEVVARLRHFVVEEIRTARRFLRQVDRTFSIDDSTFFEMGKHANEAVFAEYLKPMAEGHDMGVISEAGCPAVADPGSLIVALAHRKGYRVVPLVGPSSMTLAMMASGMNGQSYAFNGYLPIEDAARIKAIHHLENRAIAEGQTQLFIETPYRNQKLLQSLLAHLRPTTHLCIAAGITTREEFIRTATVSQWKSKPLPALKDIPAIFLIGQAGLKK